MSRVVAVVSQDAVLQGRLKTICENLNPSFVPQFYSSFGACLAACESSPSSAPVAVVVDLLLNKEAGERQGESDSEGGGKEHPENLFFQKLRFLGGHRFTPLLVIDSPITPQHLARGSEYSFFRLVDKFGEEAGLQSALSALSVELGRPSALRQAFQRIAAAWRGGQEGEVEHLLEECYQTYRDDETVLVEYGSLCLRKGQYDKAERVAAKLTNRPSQSLRVSNFLARVKLKQGDVSGALSILDRANLLSPGNLDRLVLMGDAFRVQGAFAEAEDRYEEALDVDPNYGEAKKGLGLVALSQGEADRALEFFRGTCSEDETVGLFNNTAVMAVKRAQFTQAEHLYTAATAAVADSKTKAKVFFNLGLMYRRWNRLTEAAQSFRTALELDGDFEKADRNLTAVIAGLSSIPNEGMGEGDCSRQFEGTDETLITGMTEPAASDESLTELRQSVHSSLSGESFETLATLGSDLGTANSSRPSPNPKGGGVGGGVRSVDVPDRDVKSFAAEMLGGSQSQRKTPEKKAGKDQSAAAPRARPSSKPAAPRFIDDEGGEDLEGSEEVAPRRKPKSAS